MSDNKYANEFRLKGVLIGVNTVAKSIRVFVNDSRKARSGYLDIDSSNLNGIKYTNRDYVTVHGYIKGYPAIINDNEKVICKLVATGIRKSESPLEKRFGFTGGSFSPPQRFECYIRGIITKLNKVSEDLYEITIATSEDKSQLISCTYSEKSALGKLEFSEGDKVCAYCSVKSALSKHEQYRLNPETGHRLRNENGELIVDDKKKAYNTSLIVEDIALDTTYKNKKIELDDLFLDFAEE